MSAATPFEDKTHGFRAGEDAASSAVSDSPNPPPAEAPVAPSAPPAPSAEAPPPIAPSLDDLPKHDKRKGVYERFNRACAREQRVNKKAKPCLAFDSREISDGVALPPAEPEFTVATGPAATQVAPATVAPVEPGAPGAATKFRLKVNRNAFTATRDEVLRYCGVDDSGAAGLPNASLVRAAQINRAATDALIALARLLARETARESLGQASAPAEITNSVHRTAATAAGQGIILRQQDHRGRDRPARATAGRSPRPSTGRRNSSPRARTPRSAPANARHDQKGRPPLRLSRFLRPRGAPHDNDS
jgi:hypothetical protein